MVVNLCKFFSYTMKNNATLGAISPTLGTIPLANPPNPEVP